MDSAPVRVTEGFDGLLDLRVGQKRWRGLVLGSVDVAVNVHEHEGMEMRKSHIILTLRNSSIDSLLPPVLSGWCLSARRL